MRLRKTLLAAAALSVLAIGAADLAVAQTPTPPPATAWAREAAMASVGVDPATLPAWTPEADADAAH